MQEPITFGAWLRKQRRALDLTRQEFADQVGCAEVTLRRIESGNLKPSKELASVLLERLGIPEKEHTQWINFARGASDLPGASSGKAITNLPTQLTTFIGREKEQGEVIRLVAAHRLVTLTGSGGIGKTRLCVRVGKQLFSEHADGVWFLDLASLKDATLLPQTAAALFGISTQPHSSFNASIISFLRAKATLLILDNCEHLLDACAELANTLLKQCPSLKILTTSREALGLTGEAIYRVPPLTVPDFQQLRGTFRNYESVRLFEERAKLVRMDFSLTTENGPFVAQICKHLDGIPLAIELAAARINMFSLEQIAARLQKSISLLAQKGSATIPRHQTLQAVIDWSYDLLSSEERLLFRRLALFPAEWTLKSVEDICAGDGIDSSSVMDLLSKLVDKSLVLAEPDGRYKLLETIRQYAREKLIESGELPTVRQRHLAYFLAFTARNGQETLGFNQVAALKRIDVEYENIREALDWAIESGQVKEATDIAMELSWLYWQSRALFQEAHGKMLLILKHSQTTKEQLFRATALIIAMFHGSFITGDVKQLQGMIEEAIEIAARVGEKGKTQLAWAHAVWGLRMIGKDNVAAAKSLEMGLSFAREVNDNYLLANILEFQGFLASIQRDYSQAQAFCNESISLFRELGNDWGSGRALANIGLVHYLQADYEQAKKYLENALSIHRDILDRNNLIEVLGILGKISALTGNYVRAVKLFEDKLFFAINSGWTQEIGACTRDLAYLNLYQGNPSAALALFCESLALLENWDRIGISLNVAGIASAIFQLSPERAEQTAQLLGFAQIAIDKIGIENLPYEKKLIAKTLQAASQYLSTSDFHSFTFRGQGMTIEAAVDFAQKEAYK